jgi:PST family polysaccharide transporter
MVALARLLSPREFGLVAMVTALSGFASLFAELGLGAALIQKEEVSDLQLSSVFWLNLTCGVILSLIFICGASLIASFYREPALYGITIIVSFIFIANALVTVQRILLTREMEFRTLSIADVIARILSGVAVVFMAVLGLSYWSLAWQPLIMSCILNLILWRRSNWRPSFIFSFASIRELLNFGANVLGTSTLDYWTRSLDKILIGKFFGSASLGLYSRAHMVLVFRVNSLSRMISNVFFPAMSSIRDDKERVKRAYLKAINVVTLVTFPLTLGLFATSHNFVLTFFGSQWVEMVPILQALSLLGISTAAGSLNGAIFMSQGAARAHFRLSLILKSLGIFGVIVGLKWGAVGVALFYGLVTLFNTYPGITIAGRLIGMNYGDFIKAISAPFLCSLTMGIFVILTPRWLPSNLPSVELLGFQVMTGVLIYWILIAACKIDGYLEIVRYFKAIKAGA